MPSTASVVSLFFPAVQQITGLQPCYTKKQYDNTAGRSESEWIMGGKCRCLERHGKCLGRGSQTHCRGQRIECPNQAVNEQVFIGFKQEFHDLEREGILDPLNEPDMFCLQYIYLPRHLCPEMHAMTKMTDLAKELHN